MTISEQAWADAIAAIESHDEILLACHLGPDGDALGSMIALGLALRGRGKSVTATYAEPFEVPKQYRFLPGLDLLAHPDRVAAEPALMITFDAGSLERLGSLSTTAAAAKTLIVVDHHRSNDDFGTINLVDHTAAASAVLVFDLLGRMGIPLTPEIAACLYTAVVTDTGRFQYSNTTPAVMRMAGDLLAQGIDHASIARTVYDTHPAGYLRLLSVALGRLTLVPEASMVWTWIANDDLRTAGVGLEDTEALIDIVRTAEEAEVALVVKQTPDGAFKVSMRAKSAADVGSVCESFGGGGHALAAGFTSPGPNPEAIARAVADRLAAAR